MIWLIVIDLKVRLVVEPTGLQDMSLIYKGEALSVTAMIVSGLMPVDM